MATVNPTIVRTQDSQDSVIVATWSGLAALNDVGAPIGFAAWSAKSFACTGTFAGTPTVIIEGSNDIDNPTNWVPISNRNLTNISFTAAGIQTAKDMPLWVRPRLTAGSGGASITVAVACHRQDMAGMAR